MRPLDEQKRSLNFSEQNGSFVSDSIISDAIILKKFYSHEIFISTWTMFIRYSILRLLFWVLFIQVQHNDLVSTSVLLSRLTRNRGHAKLVRVLLSCILNNIPPLSQIIIYNGVIVMGMNNSTFHPILLFDIRSYKIET